MSKLEYNELLTRIKEEPLNEYADAHFKCDFKEQNNKRSCCPACGSKDNLGFEKKDNFIHCFGCEFGGNIIDSTMKLHKIGYIPALKQIAQNLNLYHTLDDQETTAETPQEIKARQEKFEKEQKEREAQRAAKQLLHEQDLKKAIKDSTKKAKEFTTYLFSNLDTLQNKLLLFPNHTPQFNKWKEFYLGWDPKHESIVILNRIMDENDTCFTLKHRSKYAWDEEKLCHTLERMDGKWISNFNASIHPFPYDWFLENALNDDIVILLEGEKDAINLQSIGVNALTLGGVANSWEEHKELLKDKIVYIFYDNDRAGYINAIKRYLEIDPVTKETFITLFYHINNALKKGYDVSDLLSDKDIKSKEQFLHAIAYSSYKLTTSLIEDISEYLDEDLSEFYFNQPIKTFLEIKKEWIKTDKAGEPLHIAPVKGEKDIKGLDDLYQAFKSAKKDSNFEEAKKQILLEVLPKFAAEKKIEIHNLVSMFDKMFSNYSVLHKHYSQTHLSDIVTSFEKMARKTDYTFAKFQSSLCVWTGTHYHRIEDKDDLGRFVLKGFFPKAFVDKKKRSANNVEQILKDVYMGSVSLDEIKAGQKEKRVINFTNGTMFITKRGKISFKVLHDKKDAATNILNFAYDKDAAAPKWQKFLDRVIPDKDNQMALMQYIGYCLLPTHAYEAFLFLYGKSGANGKSVIMDVIRSFFGEENVANLQLQSFEGHEMDALSNKILNIGTEIDPKGLNKGQLPNLKALVSPKDSITINPKNKDPYSLKPENKPKLVFSGNDKPKTGLDDAVFRRMLLIKFDSEIKDDEKIRDLSDRFNDELSGILNMALDALQVLIKNGKFTKSDSMKEQLEAYKDEVNPLRRYISDCIIKDPELMIPKQYLYTHYKTYVEAKGNHPLSAAKFWQGLEEHFKIPTVGSQIRANCPHLVVRPWFVLGIKCKGGDVISFLIDNKKEKEVLTKEINYDINTREAIIEIDEEDNPDQLPI